MVNLWYYEYRGQGSIPMCGVHILFPHFCLGDVPTSHGYMLIKILCTPYLELDDGVSG